MTLYLPGSPALARRLDNSDHTLVACFCAAWCDTCQEYRPKLEQLASQRPDVSFVWIDIEDHPDLVGDEDIENFPTILIQQSGQNRFAGTVLPHIDQLDRLVQAMQSANSDQATGLPDVRRLLIDLSEDD